jgi:chaperonin GroEL
MSKKISNKRLEQVAFISSNGNKEISKTISDLYKTSDRVILETSKTGDTYTDSLSGLVIDRGFTSKHFVNNLKTNECIMENAVILFTDSEINKIDTIAHVIEYVIKEDLPLLIVGELSFEVLGTLNLNVQNGKIKVAHIIPPRSNYQKEVMMTDLANMTGGIFYSESAGDNLLNATAEGLGRAKKIVVGKEKTIIVPTESNDSYLAQVKEVTDEATDFLDDRINAISGKMNTLFVGAPTDSERMELYDIYEDVILACKSAIEQGVLPGAGVAFKDAVYDIKLRFTKGEDILLEALLEPYIIFSKGIAPEPYTPGMGYDARTGTLCDVSKVGILDPTKVSREALRNAVSVACSIINTNTVVL